MRLPDTSSLTSRLSRFPLGTLSAIGIAIFLFWAYGRFHQKPVPSPARQAATLPAARPRDTGKYVRVLSIDGGGIRTLLALQSLAYLEKRSGRPACELFDVMVGTGSGAFVVAALSVPLDHDTPRFTAAELIKEFPALWAKTLQTPVIHPLLSVEGRTAPKYLTRTRQKVFQEFFGDTQVGAALTTIILPAYSLREQVPFFFASDMGKSTSFSGTSGRAITEAGDFFLADAVTAATCNPAVSAPSKLSNSAGDQTETLIGAEIYANNPTLIAMGEALLRYPGKQCVMISLGAGVSATVPEDVATGWKKSGDAEEIVRFATEASQFTTSQITSALHRFGSGPVAAYIRLDPPLPADSLLADDCTEKNVQALTALGGKLTTEKAATLDRTADFLGAK
ncbi:MAG: patatin-like phospholipase family protein [Verrucomicrobia bacterium]|nr:patatin-like phospholipase family protein [Verrucomicrobiota bacterium]